MVRLFRADGRWLFLSADAEGRATIERWQREETFDRRKGGAGFDAIHDHFLGRLRCDGARAALRMLCTYVAENPAPGHVALPAADIRAAVRLLMNGS